MNINIWWFFWAININDLSRKMTVWAPRGAILHLSFEFSITRVALGRGGAGNLCHLAASPSTPIPCFIHSFPTFSHFSLFSEHDIPTNPNDITRKSIVTRIFLKSGVDFRYDEKIFFLLWCCLWWNFSPPHYSWWWRREEFLSLMVAQCNQLRTPLWPTTPKCCSLQLTHKWRLWW